jgi:hypothetical protein
MSWLVGNNGQEPDVVNVAPIARLQGKIPKKVERP